MVVDPAGLAALVDALTGEEYYAFDTEFHTERTYVPDLALIQIAWADRVALVDPLAVDPAPLAAVFNGPGKAVAHAAGQDLDVLLAACGALPAQSSTRRSWPGSSACRHPPWPDWWTRCSGSPSPRPTASRTGSNVPSPNARSPTPSTTWPTCSSCAAYSASASRRSGRLDWALDECDQVLGQRAPARAPEEAWWKLGDIRGMSRRQRAVAQEVGAWRERTAAATNRPRRMVLSDLALQAIVQRPPHNGDELRRTRGVDGRHLAQGRAREILDAIARGQELAPEQIRMPSEGRDAPAPAAAVAVCSGVVRQIADDLDFDQALLATRADIAQLLCGEHSRLDEGWRSSIVGRPPAPAHRR